MMHRKILLLQLVNSIQYVNLLSWQLQNWAFPLNGVATAKKKKATIRRQASVSLRWIKNTIVPQKWKRCSVILPRPKKNLGGCRAPLLPNWLKKWCRRTSEKQSEKSCVPSTGSRSASRRSKYDAVTRKLDLCRRTWRSCGGCYSQATTGRR